MQNKLFSSEHEIAVLSTILKYPELYYGTDIRFFMMSSIPHQIIFQEMTQHILKERKNP